MEVPRDLYPVIVIQDRYGGVHAGGEWIAVGEAWDEDEAATRLALVLKGAHGEDVQASRFWKAHAHAPWLAVGETPDAAVAALVGRQRLEELDVVRLDADRPEDGLTRGLQGAIVHIWSTTGAYEVEFVGEDGLPVGVSATHALKAEEVALVWKAQRVQNPSK